MVFTDDQDCMEAYEDHAWRHGTLHLSAPCIYTRAVEALQFKRGVIVITCITCMDKNGDELKEGRGRKERV